jgi:hypothetical protein
VSHPAPATTKSTSAGMTVLAGRPTAGRPPRSGVMVAGQYSSSALAA